MTSLLPSLSLVTISSSLGGSRGVLTAVEWSSFPVSPAALLTARDEPGGRIYVNIYMNIYYREIFFSSSFDIMLLRLKL